MKKAIFRRLALVLLLLATLALAACSRADGPYDDYNDEGKSVSIRYLANGGFINSGADAVVDVFDVAPSGRIKLIAPESRDRGKSQVNLSHALDYKFAGWYVAEIKTDGNGNALDADGNLVSESGKEPAYEAGARWDFSTDTVSIDPSKEYTSREPVLTLMAMWIPKFSFEFYAKDASGDWALISTKEAITLELPKWSNGKINMMGFPSYPGADMTFKSAYADAEMTEPITSATISGEIDYEHGVAKESTVKVYTEWYEGTWFMVEDANHLYSNARANGNYMLLADIDMTGKNWPAAFSQNTFTGKIIGNGHKIMNASAGQQGQYRKSSYGLFGAIGASAELRDVTFENIRYTVEGALNEASFGLLAGTVASGATFENVTVSNSKLIFADQLFSVQMLIHLKNDTYEIGQLFGDGTAEVATENLVCEFKTPSSEITFTVDPDGKVIFSFPDAT